MRDDVGDFRDLGMRGTFSVNQGPALVTEALHEVIHLAFEQSHQPLRVGQEFLKFGNPGG